MDIGIRSRLTTGLAVVGVGALVMSPVAADRAAAPPPTASPAAALTAVTQSLPTLRLPGQSTAQAALRQSALVQPANPLVDQVEFHVAFVADFLTTGAVLFGREFAIPGTLLQDIGAGTPLPAAVGQALQTFAVIELEAGRDLVGFAERYVSFQLAFFAHLAAMPVAALSRSQHRLRPHPAGRMPHRQRGSRRASALRGPPGRRRP